MKNKKYVTVNKTGLGLHDIAKVMTDSGHKMNHSTVRNIINKSFVKIASHIVKSYGEKTYTNEEILVIISSSSTNHQPNHTMPITILTMPIATLTMRTINRFIPY